MYCPNCGKENKTNDFCEDCNTNLVIVRQFLYRADAKTKRSNFVSRSGLVSITVSEGFAWTFAALAIFVLIIFLASMFLTEDLDPNTQTYMAFSVIIALVFFCGIPLLLGLVLLLKDLTSVRKNITDEEKKV